MSAANISVVLPGVLGGVAGPAWWLVLCMLAVQVLSVAIVSRLHLRQRAIPGSLHVLAGINLTMSGLIVLVTDGHRSPFWILFFIDLIAVGTLFGMGAVLVITAVLGVLLGGMALLAGVDWTTASVLVMRLTVLFFIGMLADRSATLLVAESERTASTDVLLDQLLEAQEAERRRLWVDIHDGPLQLVGVALLTLDRARRWLARNELASVHNELDLLRSQLEDITGQTRDILADLSQDVLQEHGLSAALRGYVERFAGATGIKVVLDDRVERRLPADVELLAYRFAQEAFSNVRKHSDARTVTVSLSITGGYLRLTIADDGRGFDVQEALRRYELGRGLGLRLMRQRAQLAGGTLDIESAPGKGTTLRFAIPVPAT